MRCPRCSSSEHRRHRSPVEKAGVIWRRHECLKCGLLFLSAQGVVPTDRATLETLEERVTR